MSLIYGDCLSPSNGLSTYSDHSFQCIIADIPYLKTQNEWEIEIPLDILWSQLTRLIKPNGVIVFFSMQDFTTKVINSQPELFRYELIWVKEKPTQFFEANNRFLPNHENILIFSPSYPHLYNPQMIEGQKPYIKKKKKSAQGTNYNKDIFDEYIAINDGTRFPTSVLYFPRDNANKGIHPTQKPLGLIELLVLSFTNVGDLVLDFCAGSGTTCVACLKHHRSYVAFEKQYYYYLQIQKRLEAFTNYHEDRYKKPPKCPSQQQQLEYLLKK